MICEPCSIAAEAAALQGIHKHPEEVCTNPATCACQHGTPLEMDPNPEGFQGYLDALPPSDPRRIAYEDRVKRKIKDD